MQCRVEFLRSSLLCFVDLRGVEPRSRGRRRSNTTCVFQLKWALESDFQAERFLMLRPIRGFTFHETLFLPL